MADLIEARADALQIRPGVAGVIRDTHGRVLLHRRVIGKGWAPPSGSVEPGESLKGALRREVREETGLGIRVGRLVGVYSDPTFQVVRYPAGHRVHFVTCLFRARVTKGVMTGSGEGTEWGWFRPSSLPSPLLAYARVWLNDAFASRSTTFVR